MCRVSLHVLPDEGGNTIVLRERNKDFQVRRTSSVTNLFKLAFILGDSTEVQTMPISGPTTFFFYM